MSCRFPVAAFAIMIFLALVATIEAKEPDKFLASLQKCSNALDSCEKALQSINASTPPLHYKDGASFEKKISTWLEYIRISRSKIISLKKHKNLKDTLMLFNFLKALDLEMDGVRVKLFDVPYNTSIPKDKDSLNNNDWIKLVENSDKELDVALGIFSNAADSYMDEMDKKLMRCQ